MSKLISQIAHRDDGACTDPSKVIALCASFGLSPVPPSDIPKGRALAAARIDEGIASAGTFAAVEALTRASLFCAREGGAITGLFTAFPVRHAALLQLERGIFNGVDVDLDLVARPGETPAAWYGWGFVATTKAAAAAVVRAAVAVQSRLFWSVPAYTRAATPDGVRIICGKMGYRRALGKDPLMVWIPPADAHAAGVKP